jgi:hypothetical protein
VHVALGAYLLAVLELQDRLVSARLCPAVPHWQVLAVVSPDGGALVLTLNAPLAERCHLKTSGDLLAVPTLVDVPHHAWVVLHLVVDVGLLLDQQRGVVSGGANSRHINEARLDAGTAGMLAKIGRSCSEIRVGTYGVTVRSGDEDGDVAVEAREVVEVDALDEEAEAPLVVPL